MDASWAQTSSHAPRYVLKMTTGLATKIVLSIMLMLLGMTYLATGRKENDFRRMLLGLALVLAALLIF